MILSFFSPFSTQLANADLESESIRGFEFGVAQEFGDHKAELTYFDQEISDAVVTRFLGVGMNQQVNSSGGSSVSGLEFAASGSFMNESVNYRLAFTAQFDEEVIDLPDYLVSFDVNYDAGPFLIGAGVSYVDGAAYLTSGNPQTGDRFLTRLHTTRGKLTA